MGDSKANISKEEYLKEEKQLKKTLTIIEKMIGISTQKKENHKHQVIEVQKNMWEERKVEANPTKELEGVAMAWQHQVDMINQAESMKFYSEMEKRLERMYASPYFARIDFEETEETVPEAIYIGICTLYEEDTIEGIVYDWRTPICSLFYDYEIGDVEYNCPAGIVKGKLILKRQYRIENQMIIYMFNSGLKINDTMLQGILSKSTDDKMKTIVNSIQKEQNKLIRDEHHEILIIQGTAGSGKTSIALHRIAYLMYRQRQKINANNFVIFSPNQIFSDYISDVLPELGEENVQRTTFMEYAQALLVKEYRIEDWNSQMEYILLTKGNKTDIRMQAISYKTSVAFIEILEKYVSHLCNYGPVFKDIYYDNYLVASKKEIEEIYLENRQVLTPIKSLNRLKVKLENLLQVYIEEAANARKEYYNALDESLYDDEIRQKVKRDLLNSFSKVRHSIDEITQIDALELYRKLFKQSHWVDMIRGEHLYSRDEVINFTLKRLDEQVLLYEDCLALTYLKGRFEGVKDTNFIKHVVIDEAQDYSLLQYRIIKHLFPKANFTLLGDLNQSINPFLNIGKYEHIKSIFSHKKLQQYTLKRSYRSTRQIAAFCSGIMKEDDPTIYLNRQGNEPQIIDCDTKQRIYMDIIERLRDYKKEGYLSIAVIGKTAYGCRKIYQALKDKCDISIITKEDEGFKKGIVVIPSYLAKGLEFDAVMICCHDNNNYLVENDRNLFYTVCSRALHDLIIYYISKKPFFID